MDRILHLKSIVTGLATGGGLDVHNYTIIRSELLNNDKVKNFTPDFVRHNIDQAGLWAHFKSIHSGTGAYDKRRESINLAFTPIIEAASNTKSEVHSHLGETFTKYDEDGVTDAWSKALARCNEDPEGAITSARTLLEETCIHILESAGAELPSKKTLPKLYSTLSTLLNISPSQHSEDDFKQILGGCQNVVERLGGLRNKIGDAHGSGRSRVRPAKRHAALAVNLASSMSVFLIETWQARKELSKIKEKSESHTWSDRTYKGINISSRYSEKQEIKEMISIVDALPDQHLSRIKRIWCDSKAGATYSVILNSDQWFADFQFILEEAVLSALRGHNGVYIITGEDRLIDIPPYWPEL